MESAAQAQRMDAIYRTQRLFYDVTRRYYLLGRDRLIAELAPPEGGTVLEIACGTGRNLDRIDRRYPGRRLYGLDISHQMLRTARAKLGPRATLAQADATAFDAQALFGVEKFDRIVLSYAISMIPGWERAAAQAADHLAPGGQLYVVDFGDQAGLPRWFRAILLAWLAKFHVAPRPDMERVLAAEADRIGGSLAFTPLHRGYAWAATLSAPAPSGQSPRP